MHRGNRRRQRQKENDEGALSRLTKDSIVTKNLHSNNVQGRSERSGRASTRSAPVQLAKGHSLCAR